MIKNRASYHNRPGLSGMFGVPEGPSPFGLFLFDHFNRTALGDNYVELNQSGFSVVSLDGNDLNFSGGVGNLKDRIRFSGPLNTRGHSFEDFVFECRFQFNSTPSATTYGVGIGIADFSIPDGQRDVLGLLYMTTSGTFGGKALIQLFNGTSNTVVSSASSSVTVANGEWYTVYLKKKVINGQSTFEFTGVRESDGSKTVATWVEPLSYPQTDIAFGSGQFCLYNVGGSIKVDYIKATVNDLKNINDLFVGDSITHGAYSNNFKTRYCSMVSNNFSVSAGSGDGTERVVNKLQNLLEYNPSRVFLMIGGNDLQNSVPTATYRGYYSDIVATLKAAKIKVVHLYATPRNATDMSILNGWIKTQFADDLIIDTFYPLKGSGTTLKSVYDIGDGVHPNQAGHDKIAEIIRDYM